jgi:outer membrane lipoprotein-sorting protein
MMKTLLVVLLGLLSLAAGPINIDSSADDVLDALDARGKDLKTLSADVKMTDIDPSVGDVSDIRTGHLHYQILTDGDSRWHALFDKKQTGRKIEDQKHEWSYAEGKLIERDYRNKTQNTKQILKPGEKMQLFNLDGPFPLPLGQDKADVHKHFDVKKVALEKDDPADTVHLQLTPIAGTDLARKFKTIDLWVDPKTDMPARITVLDGDGNSLRQTDLSNVKPNDPVHDGDFDLEKIDLKQDGWDAHDE